MRAVARGITHGLAFAAGFTFAAWCIGQGIKDGSLDDAIEEVRARRRRAMRSVGA